MNKLDLSDFSKETCTNMPKGEFGDFRPLSVRNKANRERIYNSKGQLCGIKGEMHSNLK